MRDIFLNGLGLVWGICWDIFIDNRVSEAVATAAMWRNGFGIAVIIIVILTIVLIRKHIKDRK